MMNWHRYKLEEVISDFIDYRGKTPPKVSSGIPLITAKVVKAGVINEPNEFVPEAIYDKWMTRGIPEYGDVLLTTEAPLGEVAQLNFKHKVVVGQRLITLRGKKNLLDNTFLKYSLQTKEMQARLEAVATGTTVMGIKSAELKKVEIELPDLPTQRRISEILSALDDKIELNRRIIQTLEQMAQTLFRQYFVDGIDEENLPEGWQKIPIGEIIEFAIGGDWGKEILDEQHTVQSTIIRGTDLSSIANGKFNTAPVRFIKEKNFNKRQLHDGDIIFEISGGSSDQPTGRSMRISNKIIKSLNENVIPASFCRLIRPKSSEISFYLSIYLQILYQEGGTWEYQNQSTGISNFQFTYFTAKELITFPTDIKYLKDFAELVRPIYQKLENNILEINKLTQLRDTLLPKLMSGEIDVMQSKQTEQHGPILS